MTYRLEASFLYKKTDLNDPEMNEFLDRVDEHLVDKLACKDVLIVSDGAGSCFTIALEVDGDGSPESVFNQGLSTLRTAFHAENCETPDWPTFSKFLSVSVANKSARALQDA